MAISFENDIKPFFAQYRGQMLWRLDLASYDDVRANAYLISQLISRDSSNENPMPPPDFPPFSQELIDNFSKWMAEG